MSKNKGFSDTSAARYSLALFELAQETKLPVYALGGLGKEDLSEAEKNGAYGIAGISKFWSY